MIYEPREDSLLLKKYVKKLSRNKSFLDIGSGSGILAETAIKAKAKLVLASDIDPESVKLLKQKNIKAVKSDLFANIKEKFDLIVFNPPYLLKDEREDKESKRVTTGGKKGDEIILKFLKQAPKHLNKNGKILLIISSLTPKNRINHLLKNQNLKRKILEAQSFFFEKIECWEITINHNNE